MESTFFWHIGETPSMRVPSIIITNIWFVSNSIYGWCRGTTIFEKTSIWYIFFLRAEDDGDVIFAWKWAQNTVNTDVFCIWWLWNLGETQFFASCFVMMLEKHWQAPKKPKKPKHNLTKHWQAPKKAKKAKQNKKSKDFQSMGVQNPE